MLSPTLTLAATALAAVIQQYKGILSVYQLIPTYVCIISLITGRSGIETGEDVIREQGEHVIVINICCIYMYHVVYTCVMLYILYCMRSRVILFINRADAQNSAACLSLLLSHLCCDALALCLTR